jgi:hypothetical protein
LGLLPRGVYALFHGSVQLVRDGKRYHFAEEPIRFAGGVIWYLSLGSLGAFSAFVSILQIFRSVS